MPVEGESCCLPAFDLLVELVFGNPSHSTQSPGADVQQSVPVHKELLGKAGSVQELMLMHCARCHVPQIFQ